MPLLGAWDLLISPGAAELTHDAVEGRRDALCPADVVVLLGGIPVKLEGPTLGAMGEQAAQRQSHLDAVDPGFGTARDAVAQDVHGKCDHDALMPGKRFPYQWKSCDLNRKTSSGSMPSACGGQ